MLIIINMFIIQCHKQNRNGKTQTPVPLLMYYKAIAQYNCINNNCKKNDRTGDADLAVMERHENSVELSKNYTSMNPPCRAIRPGKAY